MFDIGAAELLVIVVVAIIVIGPKEMPRALRTAGRWIGKMRRMSSHVRSGLDAMIRDAELEDSEREWRERNAKIMARTDADDAAPAMEPLTGPPYPASQPAAIDPELQEAEARAVTNTQPSTDVTPEAGAEAAVARAREQAELEGQQDVGVPELPLDPAVGLSEKGGPDEKGGVQ